MEQTQIIALLVHNYPGVLLRVTSLISRRGFNIDSLTVSPTVMSDYSRMTIRLRCSEDTETLNQFVYQFYKLPDVKKVEILHEDSSVVCELAMLKVRTDGQNENKLLEITAKYHASVVDIGNTSMTFRASGTPAELDSLIEELSDYEIMERVSTGLTSLQRGDTCLADKVFD